MASSTQHAPTPALEMPAEGAVRVLILSVLLGLGGALVASVFLAIITAGQDLFWKDIPQRLGLTGSSLGYVLLMVLIGALLVALAFLLPGHTGGSPLPGLHFDVGSREIGSVALAALGTLIFGLPLGPEAPLIACGTALGALVLRRADPKARQLGMLLGGAAAIGAIFGNPFITAFLFLEFAAIGVLPVVALAPVLTSLGTGYLVMTGLGSWSGLGQHELAVSGLAPVDRLIPSDFAWGAVVAIVTGALLITSRAIGWRTHALAGRHRLVVLFGAAAVIGVVAVVATTWSDLPIDTTLFSGETGLPALLAAGSAGSVAIVTVARMLVYGLALGAGFRGGPIFPAMAVGVGVGIVVATLASPGSESPLVVAGVAAGIAAILKLPFSAGLIAMLITAGAGTVTAPVAILGALVGWLMRVAWNRKFPDPVLPPPEPDPAPSTATDAQAAAA